MNAILSKLSSKKSFLNGLGQQLKSLVRMSSTYCVKPPVILVVGNEDKNSTDLLTKIKSLVRSEKYLVYPATSATLAGQLWWQETALLVLNAHLTEETEQAALRKWVQANGKVLDFASNKVWQDDNRGFCFEVGSDKDGELATLLEQKLNIEVAMEEDETPSLTPGFLISSTKEFWDSFPPENSSEGLGLIFRPVPDLMPSVSLVPVLETESPEFDSSLYRETLTTRSLGQVIQFLFRLEEIPNSYSGSSLRALCGVNSVDPREMRLSRGHVGRWSTNQGQRKGRECVALAARLLHVLHPDLGRVRQGACLQAEYCSTPGCSCSCSGCEGDHGGCPEHKVAKRHIFEDGSRDRAKY